ncbi:acetyltransferase [Aliiroseovarius sp. S2029]|uniref:GNAT family N-acetyltransferase n=1 Tax=Aliiroseovarius sp. S2029 TaxID=2936988 RepID=UPI0020BDA500|nr:GNAT family N-acetyltransferase [Aliiroseovarius sp. S2029]MCK8484896.1 acetyltransferase [Aliiroseovarius sp. S2029]
MTTYSFRAVNVSDLNLLNKWLREPHVAEWWDASTPYTTDTLDRSYVTMRMVEADRLPFALIQDYDVHAQEGHHFGQLPNGARGMDQFIGEPAILGRGHGSAFIKKRMTELFAIGVPVLAVDPHPDNARAIAVYQKIGFHVRGQPRETEWGPILPMEAPCPT